MKDAEEVGFLEHKEYIESVIEMFTASKVIEPEMESIEDKNILVFASDFLKSLKQIDDSSLYREVLSAISSLESKEWMVGNKFNDSKYKCLHGDASGLFEVKTSNVRLLHMPINGDFWYVSAAVIKEGDRKKKYNQDLIRTKRDCVIFIDEIKKRFTKDGVLDYDGLSLYAEQTSTNVMQELGKWEGKKK